MSLTHLSDEDALAIADQIESLGQDERARELINTSWRDELSGSANAEALEEWVLRYLRGVIAISEGDDEPRYSFRAAANGVLRGVAFRHRIPTEKYDLLTLPWRCVMGPLHPDDGDEVGLQPTALVEFVTRRYQTDGYPREDAAVMAALQVSNTEPRDIW